MLLEDFDEIYILNLHGNARIGETCPDGSVDQNVFDIMQGVSINIFVKKEKRDGPCRVFYYDLYGEREHKYDFLIANNIKSVNWKILEIEEFDKNFKKTRWGQNRFKENLSFFTQSGNIEVMQDYGEFWGITEIFETFGSGVKTERDKITIQFTNADIQEVINNFQKLSESELKKLYCTYDSRDWKVIKAKEDVMPVKNKNLYAMIHYRPFDFRWTFYTGKTRGFIGTPGYKIAKDLVKGKNLGLLFMRQVVLNTPYLHLLVTDKITDSRILYSSQGILRIVLRCL